MTDITPIPGSAGESDAEMFDLAPVSLWLEDFSAVGRLFEQWRAAGVTDLAAYLRADPSRIKACAGRIRVLKVNARTLALFEATDTADLVANLDKVFRDDMLDRHVGELTALWDGHSEFLSHSVNYSLTGRRIDIQMTGRVLPGYEKSLERVLIAIEDVTEREAARRKHAASENYAHGLFEHSPVSLWVEDFSAIKRLLDEIRARGIEDLRVFTDVHPEFVQRCMSEIRVLDVNRQTLELFQAPDKSTLLRRLGDVFRDDMERSFREQLIDLWGGKLFQRREVVNYALNGNAVHVLLQLSVLPGHESDWSLVQVALTDITARKKAETYLEFLGTHDVLTGLYNRSFYVDELNRIERKGLRPVTLIMADLNGLKAANDQMGPSDRRCPAAPGRRGPWPGGRETLLRGADRRRRIRRAAARRRRQWRQAGDRGNPPSRRPEQPVLRRHPLEPVHGGGDRHPRRTAGRRGPPRRSRDVRGEARILRQPRGRRPARTLKAAFAGAARGAGRARYTHSRDLADCGIPVPVRDLILPLSPKLFWPAATVP